VDVETRHRLADANLLARFELTRRHVGDPRGGAARFGAVDVVAIGVDAPYFNSVFVADPATHPGDIIAGIEWVEARGLPAMVRVLEELDPAMRPTIEATGLTAHPLPLPVMALEPIPATVPPPPPGVEIRTGRSELFDDFHVALESGDVIRKVFGPGVIADQDVRIAVAYLDGKPVSCGAAIRSASTIGVYAVATVERARRCGIGQAVSWAAIEAGRAAWGGTIAVLQSSDVGLSVYRSMGFEQVAGYYLYARPSPAS
jgi:GNAT superfamily N-acetyltransferase